MNTHNEKRKVRIKENYWYIKKNITEGTYEKLVVDDAILELYDKYEKAEYNYDVGNALVELWPKICNTLKHIFKDCNVKPGYDLLMENQTERFKRGKFLCSILEHMDDYLIYKKYQKNIIEISRFILDFFCFDFDVDYEVYFNIMIPLAYGNMQSLDLCDKEFNKLFKEYPDNTQIIKGRAETWLKYNKIDKAKNMLEKYINLNTKIDSDNSILFPVIVSIYETLNLQEKAKKFYIKHYTYLRSLKIGESKTNLNFMSLPENYLEKYNLD